MTIQFKIRWDYTIQFELTIPRIGKKYPELVSQIHWLMNQKPEFVWLTFMEGSSSNVERWSKLFVYSEIHFNDGNKTFLFDVDDMKRYDDFENVWWTLRTTKQKIVYRKKIDALADEIYEQGL